jgi:Aspartyl/Asparaginyl beta-hydroxylase/Domain of unknown function (DUF6817)
MDETTERIIAFLRAQGAAEHDHAGGRSLLSHLMETAEILRRWDQPAVLQHAALLHSVYGTEAHRRRLLAPVRRGEVRQVAGAEAERLAMLFAITPRRPLFAGTYRWAAGLPTYGGLDGDEPAAERSELDALIVLHMANLAEQARARDGSPVPWLVRLGRLAELLVDSDAMAAPPFLAGLMDLRDEDEALLGRAYRAGIADADPSRVALAAAVCPAVAEPCVWLAALETEAATAAGWAQQAERRLRSLGTAWDKRLEYAEWLELSERLQQPDGRRLPAPGAGGDPRRLYAAMVEPARPAGPQRCRPARGRAGSGSGPGLDRFARYIEGLAQAAGGRRQMVYPDLPSRPWHDPTAFPVAAYLQSHFAEISAELLSLDPARFQSESERIGRSGEWDVIFLYERGRRHDAVCAACPVTTRGIEGSETVRTLAGLIYVSRMRGGTHIAPHRGPTNLRLRCHLGIAVPAGDCAIRVGGETRRWTEGQCLVFDDHFEHEAWNHTGEDRIVLIVDLWHPDLTGAEIRLLEGLHAYADAAARRLARYWQTNATAAAQKSPPSPPPQSPPSPPPSPSPSPHPPPSPPPSPSPHPPPSPSPSPNSPPTRSSPRPSPAPSAEPTSRVESNPPPPKPLK